MKLRKWVQVLLLILYVLGMIGMICIEINLLLAIRLFKYRLDILYIKT